MRKKVFFTLSYLLFGLLLIPIQIDDIFQWISQEKVEKDLVSIKIKTSKEDYIFGCDIVLKAEIENRSKDLIAVYSQPYLFVVNGEKKVDNLILVKKHSRKDMLSNYVLFGQRKSGGAKWKVLEGDTSYHFLDISKPLEIVLKPKDVVRESIVIPFDLYKNYITKDNVEILIWKGWRKFGRNLDCNLVRVIEREDEKYRLKDNKFIISPNQIFVSTAVRNYIYFVHGKNKSSYEDSILFRLEYSMGIFPDHLSISNLLVISLE